MPKNADYKQIALSKINIWNDKLSALTIEQAQSLASRFDFSGGEIDNFVRKALMSEVLEGKAPTIAEIEKLCSEEKIGNSSGKRVGFNAQKHNLYQIMRQVLINFATNKSTAHDSTTEIHLADRDNQTRRKNHPQGFVGQMGTP